MANTVYTTTLPYTNTTAAGTYTIGVANGTSAIDYNTGTWTSAPMTVSQKAQIELKGEEADIIINGDSLNATLKEIKEALRIPDKIKRDEHLEKSFEEIRVLREKYEAMVKDYKEKQKVWDIISK
jgi:hypothetical protein